MKRLSLFSVVGTVICALALMGLAACNQPSDPVVPPLPTPDTALAAPAAGPAIRVGGDSDARGCKPSAGYTWSSARQECLRLFEVGVRLQAVGDLAAGDVAWIVFDQEGLQAEAFLPGMEAPLILQRQGEEGGHVWRAGAFKLFPWKGYVLEQEGNAIYAGG